MGGKPTFHVIKGIVQEIHIKTLGHRVTITTDSGNGPGKSKKKKKKKK